MNRQQRRAEERASKKKFDREGISVAEPYGMVFQTRSLLRVLEEKNNRKRASDAAQLSLQGIDLSLRHNKTEHKIACHKGCSHCCRTFVAVSAPQVFLLARFVRETRGAKFDEILGWVRTADALSRGLDSGARIAGQVPCGLLDDDCCAVYDARPIVCRTMASVDPRPCRSSDPDGEQIPVPAMYIHVRAAHDQCMWAALRGVGLPHCSYELNHALLVALEEPDAEGRWLDGEDVFKGVATDTDGITPEMQRRSLENLDGLLAAARSL